MMHILPLAVAAAWFFVGYMVRMASEPNRK